ncbi:hypothetical protein JCM8208_004475 [Rhodotorula glutinis]
MSGLATMTSHTTDSTCDKKLEEGVGRTVAVADSPLGAISEEEDGDDGAKLAGETAITFTQEEEQAVRRKVFIRIVPLLAAVYFSQFLDKGSVNYAAVMGLPLASKGVQWNHAVSAFYYGFLVAEIPQSILAQRFGMSTWLGINICLWSGALWLHSATSLFAPFFIFRFILGACESVVSPVLIASVAAWFKKDEQSRAVAAFYAQNGISTIVGGALAYGLNTYTGTVDKWRLIYFVLAAMALVVGVAVLIFLPNSVSSAKFLTPRERQIALERVRGNQSGTVSRKWKKAQALEAVRDPKVWLLCGLMFVISVPNAAITSFTSILIKSFGYTSAEALLYNMPSGAVQLVTTITIAFWADRRRVRMLPFIAAVIPSIVGFALLIAYSANSGSAKDNKTPLLVGVFLSQTFVSALSLLFSWSASNIAGSSKRSVVNGALLFSFAGGNICGSQAFQQSTAPDYIPGKITLFVLLVLLVPFALVLRWYTLRLNRKKAEQVRALVEEHGWSPEDLQREKDAMAFKDATDSENPFYVYVC